MANLPVVASPASSPKPAVKKHTGWPTSVAVIFCLFILIGGALTFYVVRGMFGFADKAANIPERFGQSLAENFKVENTFTTQINSAIGEIKHTPKLVINTYEIDVEIRKTQTSSWGVLYMGTTDVSLRTHKNKIQYFVPVETLSTGNFSYDQQRKILHAVIPTPRLDTDVVEVQSDPSQIEVRTDVGWAQTDHGAGEALRKAAQSELREAVIKAGNGEAQQALAEKDARKSFTQLLAPVCQAMGGDVKVEVEFENPPGNP